MNTKHNTILRGKTMLNEIIVPAIVSLVVTVICNRLLAIHVFKVIDTYVKELFEITKKSIRNAYSSK